MEEEQRAVIDIDESYTQQSHKYPVNVCATKARTTINSNTRSVALTNGSRIALNGTNDKVRHVADTHASVTEHVHALYRCGAVEVLEATMADFRAIEFVQRDAAFDGHAQHPARASISETRLTYTEQCGAFHFANFDGF